MLSHLHISQHSLRLSPGVPANSKAPYTRSTFEWLAMTCNRRFNMLNTFLEIPG